MRNDREIKKEILQYADRHGLNSLQDIMVELLLDIRKLIKNMNEVLKDIRQGGG